MSETGYICPRCGNTECFTAFAVVLVGPTLIHEGGWDWFGGSYDAELADGCIMRCEECEYEGRHEEFEEEELC